MNWKNITLYPELIIDVLIYLGIGALLCVALKIVYDAREKRRNRKAAEAYYQQKEEERAEQR